MTEFIDPNQQPISRVVGRRRSPPLGEPPSAESRAALARCAPTNLRAPKGIFFYDSPEEMDADRLRWTVDRVVAIARGEPK